MMPRPWKLACARGAPLSLTSASERYRKLIIRLADLHSALEAQTDERSLGAILPSLENAAATAQRLLEHLRQVARNALSQPEAASAALEDAQAIDPDATDLTTLHAALAGLRAEVRQVSAFRPNSQAFEALAGWFASSQARLAQLAHEISDPALAEMQTALHETETGWLAIGDMLTQGQQRPVLKQLEKLVEQVRPYNAAVADWFGQTAHFIKEGSVMEKFSPNAPLADALVKGYAAWDQGQGGRSMEAAQRAFELAQTDGERTAAERLLRLGEISTRWLNNGNVSDNPLTDRSERETYALFLPGEVVDFERFSQQMKSEETYLKAMRLGIVATLKGSSSAGYRALFMLYVLRGVLALYEEQLEEADFWREAALNVQSNWQTHPLFSAFDTALTRRKLVLRAEAALNALRDFSEIHRTRQALNAPLADAWLKEARQALDLLESALGQWSDGDFRAARISFDEALSLLGEAEQSGGMQLDALRGWLRPYRERAAELAEKRQVIEQATMTASLTPDSAVLRALDQIMDISEATLGADASRQVRIWRDQYRAMLRTHTDATLDKRAKLAHFEVNFGALFIEKHPAYKLFRRWVEAARALPDDVQEDVQLVATEEIDSTAEAPIYVEDA
ncbi:MAG: hypothetical protein HC915_16785, partial [Anaerolineae bacterium]|nr:hypothetical protein [Anaerolineae bacterium]